MKLNIIVKKRSKKNILFSIRSVLVLSMLPAILHRVNLLKKSEKLMNLIEGSIVQTLNIIKVLLLKIFLDEKRI